MNVDRDAAHERLARHLYTDGTDREVTAPVWDEGRVGAHVRSHYYAKADEYLAVVVAEEDR